MPFHSLGLDTRVLLAIKEAGYTEPTPIQFAAVPQILAGHDLIGIAQTGTGKTAAFTLPLLTMMAGLSLAAHLAVGAILGTSELIREGRKA